MGYGEDTKSVTIQVRRGVKVDVQEVDSLDGDRELIAEAPAGLKIAVQQVGGGDLRASPSKITMCG
jgi:hypothetical protein